MSSRYRRGVNLRWRSLRAVCELPFGVLFCGMCYSSDFLFVRSETDIPAGDFFLFFRNVL